MPVYKTRKKTEAYGYPVGILLLDYKGPFVPGDEGRVPASTNTVRRTLWSWLRSRWRWSCWSPPA